jgi:hypothetical protein
MDVQRDESGKLKESVEAIKAKAEMLERERLRLIVIPQRLFLRVFKT